MQLKVVLGNPGLEKEGRHVENLNSFSQECSHSEVLAVEEMVRVGSNRQHRKVPQPQTSPQRHLEMIFRCSKLKRGQWVNADFVLIERNHRELITQSNVPTMLEGRLH